MTDIVVVTGAAGVVGSATLDFLSASGMRCVGIDFASPGSSDHTIYGNVDLTDQAAADAVFAEIAKHGRVTGLVNVAGGFVWQKVADSDASSWEAMFRINVLTAAIASKSALAHMRAGGSIVNIGAAAANRAEAGMGPYAAAKSGVARLTEALSAEWKDRDIRVNAVLPSIVDTPSNRNEMGDSDSDKWVRPRDLAAVIAFLLSPEANAITGACIPIVGRM